MNNFAVSLTDADLLSRLKNFEDNFVEQKLLETVRIGLSRLSALRTALRLAIQPSCSLELKTMERQK